MTTDNVYVGMMVHYKGIGKHVLPSQVSGRRKLATYLTTAQAVANQWNQATIQANHIGSNNGQLETSHAYALAAISAYGANAVAVRAWSADFGGCRPGGMMGRTISHKKCYLNFAEHGTLPVFSSSSPLIIQHYTEGTDTPVIVVELYDLGPIAAGALPGNAGIEDFNLAMKAVTDGGGLELLAAVADDTMQIADGRGAAELVGYFLTGTAPLRGQLASTDLALQPANLEIPPHCTLAGDYMNEIIIARPALQPNSVIRAYGSS